MANNTENLIPKMTSNTAPSGRAFASNEASSSYQAWKAFDKVGGGFSVWGSGASLPVQVGYEFSESVIIGKYSITNNTTNDTPISWEFQGSQDGLIWDTLHTVNNELFTVGAERKEYSFRNYTSYKSYRLNITEKKPTGNMYIQEIEMFLPDYLNKFLILSNDEKVISIEKGGYSENVIPIMTDYTSPIGTASASTEGSGAQSWKAFDGNTISSTNAWRTANDQLTGWISYNFIESKNIVRYEVTSRSSTTRGDLKSWTFEGSNDGVNWDILDSKNNQASWSSGESRVYDITNNNNYKLYRVNVTSISIVGSANFISIGEIKMYEFIPSKLKQLSSISEQNYINHGLDKSIQIDLNSQMTNKILIEQSPTTLGNGNVFSKTIDTTKTPIKKVSIN